MRAIFKGLYLIAMRYDLKLWIVGSAVRSLSVSSFASCVRPYAAADKVRTSKAGDRNRGAQR
jgi:hypothetical protein